jgi:hypothetical protein
MVKGAFQGKTRLSFFQSRHYLIPFLYKFMTPDPGMPLNVQVMTCLGWERRHAGNALRINVAANLHSCRRDAGAPGRPYFLPVDSHF